MDLSIYVDFLLVVLSRSVLASPFLGPSHELGASTGGSVLLRGDNVTFYTTPHSGFRTQTACYEYLLGCHGKQIYVRIYANSGRYVRAMYDTCSAPSLIIVSIQPRGLTCAILLHSECCTNTHARTETHVRTHTCMISHTCACSLCYLG